MDPGLAIYRHRRVFVETGPGRTRGSVIADLASNASPVPLDPAAGGVMGMVDAFDIDAFHARLLEAVGA
ncbi:hypothetical protein BJF90_42260 [Pseudonocardia sp. CNS-004]|nr:hypothetical protein BJF90_42260 [Pseudonocardia sp. CNS-004]